MKEVRAIQLNQTLMSYYLYRAMGFLVPRVPVRLGYVLASLAGDLLYRLEGGIRSAIRDNVTHILTYQRGGVAPSPGEVEGVVRQVFRNLAKNYHDLFRLPRLDLDELERSVKVEGWEHLEEALGHGKGLIIASAHFGAFDVVAQILASRRIPIVLPAEHVRPERLFRYLCDLRMSKGIRLIPVDGPLLELFRALRRGEAVGLALDRDITQSGIVVEFFGAPARLPDGYAQLALRTGAPLVLAFCRRLPDNTFQAWVEPPIWLTSSGDRDRDVREGVKKAVAVMERYIGRYPEQWVITRSIWREGA